MPFDATDGPNQPILLDLPFALFPHTQPTRDFSVVLSRFFRCSDFAADNRHGWPISNAKGGPYLRSFTTNVVMTNGLSFASTAQILVVEGSLKR